MVSRIHLSVAITRSSSDGFERRIIKVCQPPVEIFIGRLLNVLSKLKLRNLIMCKLWCSCRFSRFLPTVPHLHSHKDLSVVYVMAVIKASADGYAYVSRLCLQHPSKFYRHPSRDYEWLQSDF